MKKHDYIFKKEIKILGINNNEPFLYQRYESNITPLLRAIHNNELHAIGWSHIKKYETIHDNIHNVDIHIKTDYKNIICSDRIDIPKIRSLSFDIEADSSHADFPIGDKDYTKLEIEISP